MSIWQPLDWHGPDAAMWFVCCIGTKVKAVNHNGDVLVVLVLGVVSVVSIVSVVVLVMVIVVFVVVIVVVHVIIVGFLPALVFSMLTHSLVHSLLFITTHNSIPLVSSPILAP